MATLLEKAALIIEAMPHGYRGPFRNWVSIKKQHPTDALCERCEWLATKPEEHPDAK